jgi:hypothetical protein
MWYEWNSKADFDNWHKDLCAELGFPLTGVNQATGLPDELAAKTTEYTKCFEVEGKFIAIVEDPYAEGLQRTDLRPPAPELI